MPESTVQMPDYLNTDLPVTDRVDDLIKRMTLEEKISQMVSTSPAIKRLGIPAYNWWNEALHGVGRAGIATVFPQAIGLASTWNVELIQKVACVIADEGRAKHHEALRKDIHSIYTGLTFWSPNVNIFRDPRWGRGQETYGEDPYLTARIGVSFVKGLQGDDPRYLKSVATPKHFAVHSGPEKERHVFNAVVSQRDLYTTYLPAFQACIIEAKAYSIMSAYNRTNGEACSASPTLLQKILREDWGFEGYVVSDCGAITDIFANHLLTESREEAAALAVHSGCDLECGCVREYNMPCDYPSLGTAVEKGLIDEGEINQAVRRLLLARFRLGMFDPPEQVPYAQIPLSVVDSAQHQELALETARQSLILLKNQENLLPLDRQKLKSIAVIGPSADSTLILHGNYHGTASNPISVLAGIRALAAEETQVVYSQGCNILGTSKQGVEEAVQVAQEADVVVLVMGLSQQLEGEEGQTEGNPPGVTSLGDRNTLDLPVVQAELMEAIYQTGKPVVLVLMNGSAVSINWAAEHVPAILEAWYPGQAGGTAVAEALFGLTNPGGRLPVTFYRSVDDLPPFRDYSMENRTYRYFSGTPLFSFGFGLSYTSFAYSNLKVDETGIQANQEITLTVDVQNTGGMAGDEVVQLYLKDIQSSVPVPRIQLVAFERIHLAPDEKQTLTFRITPQQMSLLDDAGNWVVEPGEFHFWIGNQQPDVSAAVQPDTILEGKFVVTT